jgi:ferrochelatase
MSSHDTSEKIGVLMMAYGGPESLDEIPGYLADIRSGRTTGKHIIEEITKNYVAIGGVSPLKNETEKQRAALSILLGDTYAVYTGMRHSSPWIEDTVRTMLHDGVTEIVGIVCAPHQSRISVDAYHARVRAALSSYHSTVPYIPILSYHTHHEYIRALADRARVRILEHPHTHVVMTAHSIPTRYDDEVGTYTHQLMETSEAVAHMLGLHASDWSFSFQSKGRSPEPWLEPSLENHLKVLNDRGVKHVTILPIGFVSDHVEILYDIDILARKEGSALGMEVVRTETLGDYPPFIRALKETVESHHEKAS